MNIGQILVVKNIISEAQLEHALEMQKREPDRYLGQILCEMGVSQSRIIRALYYSNKRKKIGQILVELKIITAEQLQLALAEQQRLQKSGIRRQLGMLLVNLRLIDEDAYVNALSVHFNMPVVSLNNHIVTESLQKAVGEKYALRQRIVVVENDPERIVLALDEPSPFLLEEIERSIPSGKKIMFCIAKATEIEDCLNKKYDPFFGTSYR